MAGRREMMTRDSKRAASARKHTHRKDTERQQQQATVMQKLWKKAMAEAKSA